MKQLRKITVFLVPVLVTIYSYMMVINTPTASAYITRTRWPGNSVEWKSSFQNGVASAPFPAGTYQSIVTAGARWSKPSTGKNFTIVNYTGQIGPSRTYVTKASFSAQGWPSQPGINIIATSGGQNSSGTIYLNSDWTWNTNCTLNPTTKQADVLTILVHEMGHNITLDHDSTQQSAVMWPNYTCKTLLTTDDKNGIGALYP